MATHPQSRFGQPDDSSNSIGTNSQLEESICEGIVDVLAVQGIESASSSGAEPIAQQSHSPDLRSICPSLASLEDTLDGRPLCADDLAAAVSICSSLAQHSEGIKQFILNTSKIPTFNKRLLLFDSDHLQIRAHLFEEGATEGFIHNHQWSFISCCLQGAYLHRLYGIIKGGQHYESYRKSGGDYSKETPQECSGASINILAQPFSAGQCMFLSAHGHHTVEPLSKEPVVTIVFRDKRQIHTKATVTHSSSDFSGYKPEHVDQIDDIKQINAIAKEFTNVLKKYHDATIKKHA